MEALMLYLVVLAALLPYILLVGGLIWASINAYRKDRLLLTLVFISPIVVFVVHHFVIEAKKSDELQQVAKFVKSNKNILQITHGTATFSRPGVLEMAPKALPRSYVVSVDMPKNVEFPEIDIIINVSRTWALGSPEFSIHCITTIPWGQRDPTKSACEQEGAIKIPTKTQSSL
jgi:hypothetical protein